MNRSLRPALLACLVLGLAARADEGMWTFDNLPLKQLKEKYGFEPTQEWLDHVRLSALHFGGGSGSFISKDGLVLTNHHVGRGSVQRLSSKDHDYIKNGFLAAHPGEELKVPNLTLRTLLRMENVTDRLAQAVSPKLSETEAAAARTKVLDELKADLEKKTGLSFDVVTLYQGGQTWLYGYKTHKDVRLVMAPEMGVAFFGGDPDNFTYPRHNLDFTLFRVYEDGKPYHPPHFLQWNPAGVAIDDLTFVVGHPGRTNRLYTLAQMTYDREVSIPNGLAASRRLRDILNEYAARSPEHARQVTTAIFGVENGLKANEGALAGLEDKKAMAAIEKAELELKAKVAADPALAASAGTSWTRIEQALGLQRGLATDLQFVGAARSATLGQALAILRLAQQETLPVEQRLAEFKTEEGLKRAKARLAGPAVGMMGMTFSPEQETLLFTRGLEDAAKTLGPQHPYVKAVLHGRKPEAIAKEAVEGTKLGDPATRKALLEGGLKALEVSTDPMIALARAIEPLMLTLRRQQDEAQAIIAEHGARIAKARFAVYGTSRYPDATSSLRIAFGTVGTYPANGTWIQPFTTFMGMYDRHLGWGGNAKAAMGGAWTLPPRWIERKDRLDLATPFNFVHSVDIIGGNSGSPVVNRKGELVGLIFDGNIESNAGRFFFDERVNRGVSVDLRAIVESLRTIYDAPHLVAEISGK